MVKNIMFVCIHYILGCSPVLVTEYLCRDEYVCGVANYIGKWDKIYYFVRDKIKYQEDLGGDIWRLPRETLRLGYGDCDDKANLLAAMLLCIGKDVWVRVGRVRVPVSWEYVKAGEFDHVWVLMRDGVKWIPLDPSCINCKPGQLGFIPKKIYMDYNQEIIRIHDPRNAEKYIIHEKY